MKDITPPAEFSSSQVVMNMNATYNQMETEQIESQFKTDTAWKRSVLRVFFKNESFARKYKVKIEKFLEELLEEGEEFDVYHPSHTNHEQEYEDNQQAFRIDKVHNESFDETKTSLKVPVYSSAFEDTLHCDKEETSGKIAEEKPSMMTCFNCLGNHHMKQCPEKMDRNRINENKKEILAGNIRYHTDDQNNGSAPGKLSDSLRDALGLRKNQLPQFIYHMRVIGYPPGWMSEAVFEQSGLSLFDSNGEAVGNEQMAESPNTGATYDATKFIEFPGFNTPVPEGFVDEWKNLNMPPLQPHQQLSEALKSPNIINSSNLYKRKQNNDDEDPKKLKYVAEQPCSPLSKVNVSENHTINPEHSGNGFNFKTPDRQKSNRHSMSISMSPGTPVLEQGNPYQKLPDANKFAEGITEHLPFENLPDATGTFEKMRGVISDVQKKLNDIKKS